MTGEADLLRAISDRIGISHIISIGLIERSLLEIGKKPIEATRQDYVDAMEHIQWRLGMYFTPLECEAKVKQLRVFLGEAS